MAITQLKDGRWLVYYRRRDPDGKSRIKKEYFGRGAEAEARAVARNAELKLKRRRPANSTLGPAFADLAEAYTKGKDFNRNSKKHLKIRLSANILPFFGSMPAIKITDQDLDRYIEKRRRDPVRATNDTILRYGVKNSTISRELTDIKAILNWAVRRRPPLIGFNPVASYQKPKPDDAVIPPPTLKELDRIIKAASPHLVRAIFLSHYTGLRPGSVELLSLTWRQVDFEAKTILIISAQKGGPRARLVPVEKSFLTILKSWHETDGGAGPIIHYRGGPINSIKKAWKGALIRAKIGRRLRPYDIRHFFVTRALEDGADIKALAEVVGSRPETLMRHYQHVTSEMHRKIVAKIPPLKPPLALVKGKK